MFVVTKFDLNLFVPLESHDRIAKSAAKIAISNFQWSFTTLLLFNSSMVSGVDLFLKLYKKTQIVGKGTFYPPFAQRTRQYILFGTDIVNIEQMLHWMSFHQFDNTGNYIVTCQSQNCNENHAINIFWNYRITKVVFVKLDVKGEVTGYTFFHPDENCQTSKPMKIQVCAYEDSSCSGMFPHKLKNLHGCPITVSTFKQVPYMNITNGKPSGADGDLLLLIAKGLNASLKMMTPRIGDGWGRMQANGTWSGSLADLLDDVANFSMTSAAITLTRFSHFQMSIGYFTANVVWITHPADAKPASVRLFQPFETLSQIVLAVSFIFVGLGAWFVNSQYWPYIGIKSNDMKKSNDSVIFYSWMICMGLPSTKLPAKPAFVYMTLFWIWYCFLIRTFYQVCLISSLQGDFYYDELNSIEDAYYKNYSFGGGSALKDYYIDYPLVYDNWQNIDTTDIIPTLMNLSQNKFVLAMNLETAKTVIKKNKLWVRIIPQKVINSPTVIFFKKFSPLADSVNIILWRLIEAGFTDKLYKTYATKSGAQYDTSREPITLEHYTGCYMILLLGYAVSTVLFIIEIFQRKLLNFCLRFRKGK